MAFPILNKRPLDADFKILNPLLSPGHSPISKRKKHGVELGALRHGALHAARTLTAQSPNMSFISGQALPGEFGSSRKRYGTFLSKDSKH